MCKRKKEDEAEGVDRFKPITLDKNNDVKKVKDYDLNKLFERSQAELTLQQTKRDQILTVYLAAVSFIIPFTSSLKTMSMQNKGVIFLAVAIVGIMFTLISVRYRVYKEVYWLCCQSLTCLMSIQPVKLTKDTIQTVFYRCMEKKGHKYVKLDDNKKPIAWNTRKYFKSNLFSAETLYYLILAFVTSILVALSLLLILMKTMPLWGVVLIITFTALLCLVFLIYEYFSKLMRVFYSLVDNTTDKFNYAFEKAWFLHLYLDDYDLFEKENTN